MKDEYDFGNAKRGAVASGKGKTRISIMLDDTVIEAARARAESAGIGYQTVINNVLRQVLLSQYTYDLTNPSKQRAASLHTVNEGITHCDVEALEHQLIAVAHELNRVFGTQIDK